MLFCGLMSTPAFTSFSHELNSNAIKQKHTNKPFFNVCPNLFAMPNAKYLIIEKT